MGSDGKSHGSDGKSCDDGDEIGASGESSVVGSGASKIGAVGAGRDRSIIGTYVGSNASESGHDRSDNDGVGNESKDEVNVDSGVGAVAGCGVVTGGSGVDSKHGGRRRELRSSRSFRSLSVECVSEKVTVFRRRSRASSSRTSSSSRSVGAATYFSATGTVGMFDSAKRS